jgi:alkylated DNA nucleotide flippase Atl1
MLDDRVSGAIGSAYQFFRSKLVRADDPADPHDIERIEAAVLDRFSLVEIIVERDDNAFRIFESLNNTGMRLSQVDLIRNYVFMMLPTKAEHVYATYWRPLQRLLDDSTKAMEQLMYLVLVLKGEEATYNDIYRGHQELLDQTGGDEAKIERYVAELARRARHLNVILRPEHETDSRISASLRFLNEWQASTAYPAIMKLLELREDGDATDDDVAQALRYIESFLVRRLIAGVPTNNLNRVFQRLPGQLSRDEPIAETVRSALSPARLYWSTDKELREAIRTRQFYWQGRGPQKKLVLRRLAETYRSPEQVDLADKNITIEHVLPQHLTDEWRAELSRDSEDPAMLHRELVHTLGNLTLTGYNSALSDLPFVRKREQLSRTSIAMNQDIAEQPQWGKTEIYARADDLAEQAIKIWPGPQETDRERAPERDWTLLHNALAALPPATWTTYGDVAELIGSHAVPVGVHLANERVLNAHRVLTTDRRPSQNFHWHDEDDERNILDVLAADGIKLDDAGRADPSQRLSARELAELLGLPGAEEMNEAELAEDATADLTEREQRFQRQLGEQNGPKVAGAVNRLFDHWRALGGDFQYGNAANARCSPILRQHRGAIKMLNIYTRTVEVPFSLLKGRSPFDDPAVREELRQRVNDAPGVDIPPSKLELYPSFPVTLLADDAVWDVITATLDWFADQVKRADND